MGSLDVVGVALLLAVALPFAIWQALPVPERIAPGVIRQGKLTGLVLALVVGIVAAGVAGVLVLQSLKFAWNTVP